jgi:hypothetical protein
MVIFIFLIYSWVLENAQINIIAKKRDSCESDCFGELPNLQAGLALAADLSILNNNQSRTNEET